MKVFISNNQKNLAAKLAEFQKLKFARCLMGSNWPFMIVLLVIAYNTGIIAYELSLIRKGKKQD